LVFVCLFICHFPYDNSVTFTFRRRDIPPNFDADHLGKLPQMHSSQLNFRFLLWLSGAVLFECTAVNLDNQCVKPIFVLMTISCIVDVTIIC
jgi:hypothetical protein